MKTKKSDEAPKGKAAASKKEEKPTTVGIKELTAAIGTDSPAATRRHLRALGKGAKNGDEYSRYEWPSTEHPEFLRTVKAVKARIADLEKAAEERKNEKKGEGKKAKKAKGGKKAKAEEESEGEDETEELD